MCVLFYHDANNNTKDEMYSTTYCVRVGEVPSAQYPVSSKRCSLTQLTGKMYRLHG